MVSQVIYSGGGDTLNELRAFVNTLGDELSLTVTGADAEGNPLPEARSIDLDVLKKILESETTPAGANAQLVDKEYYSKWVLWDDFNNIEVAFSEVGVGISQLFPLVVAALQSKQGIIACEQPELHVHPRIQIGIGDLLTQANNNSTFLIETHSEHLVLRILRRIRETSEGELPEGLQPVSPADVSIVYMEPGEAGVRTRRIEIDSSGEFTTRWPNGFFAERREELF